jgi:hypothetical protein
MRIRSMSPRPLRLKLQVFYEPPAPRLQMPIQCRATTLAARMRRKSDPARVNLLWWALARCAGVSAPCAGAGFPVAQLLGGRFS